MTTPGTPRRRVLHPKVPPARRIALAVAAAAVLAAVGALIAAAVQQSGKVVDTNRLPAPTRPPLQVPVVADSRRLPPAPASALGAVPPRLPPSGAPGSATLPAGVVPPASLPQAAPPTAAAPRPTPTPQLAESLTCRRGIRFDVKPDTALVTINGEPVGEAGRWEDEDDALELPRPGVYYVRLSCRGCRTAWFKVTVDPDADDKIVKIKLRNDD